MHAPARCFLSLRAIGAPAIVVSLALQGIYRGFKDTRTPVICVGMSFLVYPKNRHKRGFSLMFNPLNDSYLNMERHVAIFITIAMLKVLLIIYARNYL